MKTVNTLLSTAIAGALFSAQAVADDHQYSTTADLSAWEENTWLTLSGEIASVDGDTFVLQTQNNRITVEFDDNDGDADASLFEKGSMVTVSGEVDKDLITKTALDAASVFVHDWNTTYVSNPDDNIEYDRYIATATVPSDMNAMTLVGTVAGVNGEVVELNTGFETVKVDTSELEGQPLNEEGFMHIQEGDRVKVDATLESAFFNEAAVVADMIVRMNDVSENGNS